MPQQINNYNRSTLLLPVLAITTLLVNSGCHETSEANQPSSRTVAQSLAQEQEIIDSNKQYQTEIEQSFINKLNKINTENKTTMYHDLIALCNEAVKYNSNELSKARYKVLPELFFQLKQFAFQNLPGFQSHYNPQYLNTKDPRECDRNKSLEVSQFGLSVIKYCEHKLHRF